MARLLYQQFVRNEDEWKSLPLLAQWDLNQKVFHNNSCPSIPLTFDPKKLPRRAGKYASEYSIYYLNLIPTHSNTRSMKIFQSVGILNFLKLTYPPSGSANISFETLYYI